MRRLRAFTLLELLVIISIMGLMVTVGIVSVRSGQGAARVKGATRDVFAAIRRARSTALVTQQPAIVTYSVGEDDGEPVAKIEITSAKLMSSGVDRSKVRTVTGGPLKGDRGHAGADSGGGATDGAASEDGKAGDSLEDVLFSPIATDIVKGMRLKVVVGEEGLAEADAAPRRQRVSVFSNVDYLLGRYKESTGAGSGSTSEKKSDDAPAKESVTAESQEPVSVVWETNGRVEPHQVWVYADGTKPEDGLAIRIDRFGAATVVSGDGRED